MNQQPDKLFREKLEGYQRPAPASAWDKIETNLDKKNPKGLWWKIAASLLLVAVATYILWPKNQPTESSLAKKVEKTKSLPATTEDQKSTKLLPSETQTPVAPESVQENKVAKADKEDDQSVQEIEEPILELEQQIAAVDNSITETEVEPILENAVIPELVVVQVEASTEKSDEYITLVVTAEEANKYLTKNTNTEATSDNKKTSSLRKLLKKASDLTNDQRPLADLRQKKDEILALNFDSKKQRGQNK